MKSTAKTPQEYLENISLDKKNAVVELRKTILKNLPKGFKEEMSYGMIGYVVPLSKYSEGYHCNPKLPLPFMNLGAQKNFIVLHHLGIYGNPKLLDWFTNEYSNVSKTKLDIGKGCIRFKKPEHIPFPLMGELVSKVSVDDWIDYYEKVLRNR